MCKYWLNSSKKKKWSVVYTALTQVRNKTLEHLKYDEDSTGDSATLCYRFDQWQYEGCVQSILYYIRQRKLSTVLATRMNPKCSGIQ